MRHMDPDERADWLLDMSQEQTLDALADEPDYDQQSRCPACGSADWRQDGHAAGCPEELADMLVNRYPYGEEND